MIEMLLPSRRSARTLASPRGSLRDPSCGDPQRGDALAIGEESLRATAFEYSIGALYMTKAVLDDRPTLRGWVSLDVCILVPLSAFWTGGAQGVLNRYNEM